MTEMSDVLFTKTSIITFTSSKNPQREIRLFTEMPINLATHLHKDSYKHKS